MLKPNLNSQGLEARTSAAHASSKSMLLGRVDADYADHDDDDGDDHTDDDNSQQYCIKQELNPHWQHRTEQWQQSPATAASAATAATAQLFCCASSSSNKLQPQQQHKGNAASARSTTEQAGYCRQDVYGSMGAHKDFSALRSTGGWGFGVLGFKGLRFRALGV